MRAACRKKLVADGYQARVGGWTSLAVTSQSHRARPLRRTAAHLYRLKVVLIATTNA